MSRILAWALCLSSLLVAAAPLAPVDAQAGGVKYELFIECPDATGEVVVSTATRTGTECPVRAIDPDDLMGDPSLAVDPLNPSNLVIASLHGQASNGYGPTLKSRAGQVFTTFTSQDGGAANTWVDNPFFPPDRIAAMTTGVYGEHPQVTLDPYGHVYVGSLYALINGTHFDYVIGAQKFESLSTIDEEQSFSNGAYNVDYIQPRYAGNAINDMWFTFNPVTDNMTMVWFEHVPPPWVPPCEDDTTYLLTAAGYYVKAGVPNAAEVWQETNGIPGLQTTATCPLKHDAEVITIPGPTTAAQALTDTALVTGSLPGLMPPTAPDEDSAASANTLPDVPSAPSGSTGPLPGATPSGSVGSGVPAVPGLPAPIAAQPNATDNETFQIPDNPGVISVVWTSSNVGAPYYMQKKDWAIGPCSASTNPVMSFGYLYIGCVAEPEQGLFPWHPETTNRTVELFRMQPDGGKPVYMGAAPAMPDGIPKLGVRSDGRLALVAAGASADGNLQFSAAYGDYDPIHGRIVWGKTMHLGGDIIPANPTKLVKDANIQEVIYREQSGALHVILKTTVAYVPGEANADDLLDNLGLLPHIEKSIVAINEEYGFLFLLPLKIGDPTVRNQDATIMAAPEAAFQDISDDFLQLPTEPFVYNGMEMGDYYQREFFAIADYGTVLFAEVVEVTEIRAPNIPYYPPPPAVNPAPATVNFTAPVAGVSISGALAATLAVHRRKNPLAAFTKGE